jgi:hypothetical protein
MEPDASQTPCYAVPVPSIVPSLPTKSGILKKPAQIGPSAPVKRHKYPPGNSLLHLYKKRCSCLRSTLWPSSVVAGGECK